MKVDKYFLACFLQLVNSWYFKRTCVIDQ